MQSLTFQPRLFATITITVLATAPLNVPAVAAITKCIKNGEVTYTDLPCPSDAQTIPFDGHVAPPDDPEAAHQRHLDDQRKLEQIRLENQRLEDRQQREARSAAQYEKQRKEKELMCKKLNTRRKLAQQNQSDYPPAINKRKADQARLQAQLAEDKYAEYCSIE